MSKIDFPIVGIGASAGGLKVLQDFFDSVDAKSDMAFVVITHLAPEKTSALDELLAQHTSMEVQQVRDTTRIQPNYVYIIPPNKQLHMEGNELLLAEKEKGHLAVIDIFFRSMAKECEKLAMGIILSGTGSDGTLGLKAVKEFGGVTMVQDPQEAEYSGMPRSAIDTDIVDFILPVKKLAQKVLEHKEVLGNITLPLQEENLSKQEMSALQKIFSMLAAQKGYDFRHYKRSSILRRLQRRLFVSSNKSINEYQHYLEQTPAEITELFKDLLISVTNFFRDPKAFEFLEKKVIPGLFENKKPDDPIRIWIPGCATGEEVYSLAILLYEHALSLSYMPQIKIFGTDISDEALRVARRGIYSDAIATDVSKKRLQRFFHKVDSGYRVRREIREKVLISNHDILSDPPFLNQDLISCRNLLIYFNQELQSEVLKIVHYTLQPEGYLFLGMADSTIGATDLFAPVNKNYSIYKARKVPLSQRGIPRFPLLSNPYRSSNSLAGQKNVDRNDFTFDKIHYSLLATQYAPASVIIDENNQVMHSSKGVDKFLSYFEGEPTYDLLKMLTSNIQRPLRSILFQFNQLEKPHQISKKIKIHRDDELQTVQLGIRPVEVPGFPEGFRQVTFREIKEPKEKRSREREENPLAEESEIIEQLENELHQTKEHLQQTIEEYETSNEELMASNEELQSMNEELQTTTEELETSKEELQSVNEELRTVNQELENKIDELKQANDDLKNLVESTEIGILFLDKQLKIRLYTGHITNLYHVIESDIGRPLSDVNHQLEYDTIISDVREMLEDSKPIQKQVSTQNGDWYSMRIKPYKTTEYNVEGAVITFVDITDLKKAENELIYRAKNEQSLAKLGQFILEHEDSQLVLNKVSKMLADELHADFTAIMELDNNELLLKSGVGWPKEDIGTFRQKLGKNSEADYILGKGDPVIISGFEDEKPFKFSEWLSDREIISGIVVTVKGIANRYGVLGIYNSTKREFTAHEVNFVQNTANMVGDAIERIQTEMELREAYEKLEAKIKEEKKLQREILDVEKKERWRLGQYLHDGAAQNLIGIKMLLDIMDPELKKLDKKARTEIEKIKRLVVKSETNIRELSHFILPIEIGGKISKAFKKLIDQTNKLYDIQCNLKIDGFVDNIKDPAFASSLYYITQEAIRNAIHHGQADGIEINFSVDKEYLYLDIKDNGIGYKKGDEGNGKGINIMRHRAELLGGVLEIVESKNGGAIVKCKVPLQKVHEENKSH